MGKFTVIFSSAYFRNSCLKENSDKKQLTKFSSKQAKESKNEEVVDAEEIKK